MGRRVEGIRARFVVQLLITMLAGAACSMTSMSQQLPTGDDIVIGVPNAATGDYNVEGPLTRQGYDLWAEWTNQRGGIEVNGTLHKVRLIYQDDQSQPQMSAQIAQQMLTTDRVQFLLSPYGSTTTAAVAAVAEQHRIPLVASNAGARQVFMQGFHYTFGILAPVDLYPAAALDWELSGTPKPATIAVLSADDQASLLITKGTVDYATSKGIKVVYYQQYPAGTTNLFTLVQAAKAVKPDIFFNSGHFLEAVAAHKAAKDLGLDAKVFSYAVGPAQPEFVQALGSVADFAVTATPWNPQAKFKADFGPTSAQYVAAFRKKYLTDKEPGFVTADATAAGLALEMAIMHANSLDPEKVRAALATLDVNTFYGRLKFDAQGQNTFHNVLVEQIQNGQLMTIYPPELATASGAYPAPTWEARFGVPAAPPKPKLPGTGQPTPRPRRSATPPPD
jgi:branched-chain amino acid transport system substrate-binding protein